MQSRFIESWPRVRTKRRVAVHVPSLSFEELMRSGIPRFSARQNLQMARLCGVSDPLVDVIYVAPFQLPGSWCILFFALHPSNPNHSRIEPKMSG